MALNPLLKKLVTQSANKYSGGGSNAIKPKEGRNTYRIIMPQPGQVPWVGNDGMFFRELGVHWIKPDENAKPMAVVGSEEICYQRPSAVGAAIDMAIANAYDEETKALYESWKARKSILVNVVDRSSGQVEVLELSPTTFAKIMEVANLYDDDSGIDILDHQNGMDIVITKSGKGLNTKYDVAVAPMAPGKTFAPVTDEQVLAAKNLDDYISANFFRGEEQKALNSIAQVSGISVPQIGGPATPTQALTSAAASVAEMASPPVQTTVSPGSAVADAISAATSVAENTQSPVATEPSAMTPEQMQAEMERLQQQLAAQQGGAQQPTQPTQPAQQPATTQVTPDTSVGDMQQDEVDALLAGLNEIGN